jgi:hypothetical protein
MSISDQNIQESGTFYFSYQCLDLYWLYQKSLIASLLNGKTGKMHFRVTADKHCNAFLSYSGQNLIYPNVMYNKIFRYTTFL